MSRRDVCIEAYGSKEVKEILEKGQLEATFLKAVAKAKSAKVIQGADYFGLTTSYDDFKMLSEQGIFSPAIVAAFQQSDAKLNEVAPAPTPAKTGFLSRLWDALQRDEASQPRKPMIICPTALDDGTPAQVTVRRYGSL